MAGLYTLGSAIWCALAAVKPDYNDAYTSALRGFIAVATVHVLLLDPIKKSAK
ncbi:hypothetical protein [Streptomyces sp. NPDC086787]|uniref:hypothetical protein n=1 Tax=Streptomyces sp. NPDC086787 TaxID=3365759 RepID=UPI00383028AD